RCWCSSSSAASPPPSPRACAPPNAAAPPTSADGTDGPAHGVGKHGAREAPAGYRSNPPGPRRAGCRLPTELVDDANRALVSAGRYLGVGAQGLGDAARALLVRGEGF